MMYVNFPIGTNPILNIPNIDTYCFLWSIVANIHPADNHPYGVSKYEPCQNELIFTNIDFTNGMKIVVIPRFEK